MKRIISLALSAVFACSACVSLQNQIEKADPLAPQSEIVEGRLHIKLSEAPSGADEVNSLLSLKGDFDAERMYPHAGRFEERHKAYGLDRWYTVRFSTGLPATKAHGILNGIEGIELVEYDYKLRRDASFNDPHLSLQWHYDNDSSADGSIPGSDINLSQAWEIETGSPDVIVAICDGGIDYSHSDLARNMWTNLKELNGTEGIDDDNNGYTDDIYGYNFIVTSNNDMEGKITADDHGTHVAGTVAAVNNNELGVSGIAGGNGSPNSGVRLMSVQTSDDSNRGAYISTGIVYAADNGAVLMNCSWHIPDIKETPSHIKEAINYFNAVAGCDNSGAQNGPMKGGLVIFAAGNDHKNTSYPAMDDNVKAVASIGGDFKMAYYSNFGDWVDYTAPGGDSQKGMNILSTVPGNYAYMQGTSMAAPHVTGVAALAVSKFKGQGFTREALINILDKTANPIIYEYNDSYIDQMGAGLVDAYSAVRYMNNPPVPVTDLKGEAKANTINLHWTVPGSEKDGPTYAFRIYYSKSSLVSFDPSSPGPEVKVAVYNTAEIPVGTTLEYSVGNLEFEQRYYFRIVSENISGKLSEASNEIAVTTVPNLAPIVKALGNKHVTAASHDVVSIDFEVFDPEGQQLEITIRPSSEAASFSVEGAQLHVKVNAVKLKDDAQHQYELIVSDPFVEVKDSFSVSVKPNHAPTVKAEMSNLVLNSIKDVKQLDMGTYFNDVDGEQLDYTFAYDPSPVVKEAVEGDTVELSAFSYGTCTVDVTAKDARAESAKASFKVLVRDGSAEVDIFPNPVVDFLTVRTAEDKTVDIAVSNKLGAAIYSQNDVPVGPFNPCRIDMSDQPAGVYYIKLVSGDKSEVYSIVKK